MREESVVRQSAAREAFFCEGLAGLSVEKKSHIRPIRTNQRSLQARRRTVDLLDGVVSGAVSVQDSLEFEQEETRSG